MATEKWIGDAEIRWPGDGTEVETHPLRMPLQNIRAAGRSRHLVSESIDYGTRNVITLGQVYEIVATIRYDDDPEGLVDLLFAGMSGTVLSYDDGVNLFDCYLISPSEEEFDIEEEEDFNIYQEGRLEIRLRRTNGLPFTGLFGEVVT